MKCLNSLLNPQYPIKLLDEAKLFCDWYVPNIKKKEDVKRINSELKKLIKLLTEKIKMKNCIFVHRDFHISNIVPYKNSFGLLDSQDAVIVNKAYDLASIVDDVRFKTSEKDKVKLSADDVPYFKYCKF